MGGLQPSPQAFSLDPLSARSLGESISRVSLSEYLSVRESRNERTENAWGLGWVDLCSSWNPFLWNLT